MLFTPDQYLMDAVETYFSVQTLFEDVEQAFSLISQNEFSDGIEIVA